MIGIVRLRGGERLVLGEYPKHAIARLNERLNAIAAETDDEDTTEGSEQCS